MRRQLAQLIVKLPDEDLVETQVHMQYKAACGIGLDHVRVSPIVSTDGEAAGWRMCRFGRSELAGIKLDVRRFAYATIGQNGQHGHRTGVGHRNRRRRDAGNGT